VTASRVWLAQIDAVLSRRFLEYKSASRSNTDDGSESQQVNYLGSMGAPAGIVAFSNACKAGTTVMPM